MTRPDHGTRARANGRLADGFKGCPCQRCRAARERYRKRRLLLNTSGRPLRIPAAPVARHIRALLDAGTGWPTISKKAGCSTSTLHRILNGQELTRRTVADRILAVQPKPAPGRFADSVGTVRRLQALMAIGYSLESLSQESGVNVSVLIDALKGRKPRVRGSVADRVAAAYDRLCMRPGDCARSRNRAARESWVPPLAWSEGALDDPSAVPETASVARDRYQVAADRQGEILHLAAFGVPAEEIAARVGVTTKYVREQLADRRAPGWRHQGEDGEAA
jgi:lambda repressor-like predicted transcriptional regulator